MTDKTKRIIQTIASKEGISPKEVENKMMESIRAAMSTSDPHTQAIWKQICPDGKESDLDTFLDFMTGCVNTAMNLQKTRNTFLSIL